MFMMLPAKIKQHFYIQTCDKLNNRVHVRTHKYIQCRLEKNSSGEKFPQSSSDL